MSRGVFLFNNANPLSIEHIFPKLCAMILAGNNLKMYFFRTQGGRIGKNLEIHSWKKKSLHHHVGAQQLNY